ncbi:cell division protein FtsQ/DivIB [Halomonas sp. KAO]|uniref:cell division protein FtsQ/DivIB n=1 Tax=unclassified Halomonas TaxID=2609666 RepID=UPI00189FD477|nr:MULTISPECIES: cell division protein FtsQ/DivIB [unclassified Halomonas]MBF7054454.1 cell division protein FtsQ/DivIB [Halomonas sp. KAO]MDT0500167.1 cell division protein FtsQ/DivIB [Halomonas sp. PAR7]MDT0511339.1 cell division protein FtsQ/DivIB [Halomonas sp. LES1]MDT0590373.1 cell division protein FtsQ/DivIB [Halomonas sp. PAR8]
MSQRGGWLGVVLLLVLFGAGGRALWLWLDRPLERVSIGGDLEHVSADYLRDRLSPLLRGHTWLSVDVSELREQALTVDWIAEARVSREWPNALTLELVEEVPVARWNDDALLNPEGEPFAIGSVSPPGGLPDLAGPKGSGAEVLAYHERLATRFAEMGLELTQLRLEPRGAWRFQLDDNVWVMLGRGDREGRLARLTAAWHRQLERQASHIRYIDLRYPNGVAVAWHGEGDPLGQDDADDE